eukprot:gene22425-36425_t
MEEAFAALRLVEGRGFHLTLAYFWVQMVTHALEPRLPPDARAALFAALPQSAQASALRACAATRRQELQHSPASALSGLTGGAPAAPPPPKATRDSVAERPTVAAMLRGRFCAMNRGPHVAVTRRKGEKYAAAMPVLAHADLHGVPHAQWQTKGLASRPLVAPRAAPVM